MPYRSLDRFRSGVVERGLVVSFSVVKYRLESSYKEDVDEGENDVDEKVVCKVQASAVELDGDLLSRPGPGSVVVVASEGSA